MKGSKFSAFCGFVWRAAVTVAAVLGIIGVGGTLFSEDGIVILIEKMTVLSAGTPVHNEKAETEISVFTTTATTTTTVTTVGTTAVTTATTATTASTTVPTGEDVRKVSEEQLLKGTVSFGGINVKNANKNHGIDIEKLLKKRPDCEIEKNGEYQVLIIHTHTTECYAQEDLKWYSTKTEWRTTKEERNITSVGAIIAEGLNDAGIRTLHVTVKHDYPKYNGAYNRAKETISEYLKKYPSIKMVIDVHRDSITRNDGTKVKPTAVINGKKAAQVMIISGCDDEGDLNFPDWEYNLTMALQLQKQLNEDWEGLARPLYFAPFRYNMHMTHNSLLIEIGTEVNTLEEAQYTAGLVSESLATLLSRYIKE